MSNPPTNFAELVGSVLAIINLAIPLLFALAFVVIIYGLFKSWILDAGTDSGPEEGRNIALVGVVGLIVMSVVWALVNLLGSSLFGS